MKGKLLVDHFDDNKIIESAPISLLINNLTAEYHRAFSQSFAKLLPSA